MERINYVKNLLKHILKEEVEENTTGFNSYDDFKNREKSKDVYVYHRTPSENIESIFTYGGLGCREWGDTMVFGRGIYTTLGDGWKDLGGHGYGDAVIKFRLKNGLSNFVFANDDIQKEVLSSLEPKSKNPEYFREMNGFGVFGNDGNGSWEYQFQPFRDRMKSAMSPKDFNAYEQEYNNVNGTQSLPNEFNSRRQIKHGINPSGKKAKTVGYVSDDHTDDEYFDRSNLDGIIYSWNGRMACLIKKADALIPVEYAIVGDSGVFRGDDSSVDWKSEFVDKNGNTSNEEDRFETLNNSVDIMRFRDYDASYKDYRTPKPVRGILLIKKSNGKGNYVDGKTGKKMFFADIDNPSNIDIHGNATFDIGERHFAMSVDEHSNVSISEVGAKGDKTIKSDFTIDTLNRDVAYNRTYQETMRMVSSGELPEIWKSVPADDVVGIMQSGVDPEKVGLKGDTSLYYGRGVYATRSKDKVGGYGGHTISFAQTDGYNDFLIFDNDARAEHDPGNTVYDEIIRLVPKEMLPELDRRLKSNSRALNKIQKYGLEAFKDIPNGFNAGYAKAFYEAMSQNDGKSTKTGAHSSKDESLLAKTGIQGYIYNGKNDELTVMPRDFSSSIPLTGEDGVDTYVTGGKKESEATEKDKEDAYNIAKDRVYGYSRQGFEGEFTDTGKNGVIKFPLKGGKTNYQHKNGNMLLPDGIDIVDSTSFVDGGNGPSASFTFMVKGQPYPTTMKVEKGVPVFYVNAFGGVHKLIG